MQAGCTAVCIGMEGGEQALMHLRLAAACTQAAGRSRTGHPEGQVQDRAVRASSVRPRR